MLTPKQLFTAEQILIRNHPGCNLEEARDIELQNPRCLKIAKMLKRYFYEYGEPENKIIECGNVYYNKGKVIGLPPCLARVLEALGSEYMYFDDSIMGVSGEKIVIDRTLANNGVPLSLREQSEETQDKIAELLGWKE